MSSPLGVSFIDGAEVRASGPAFHAVDPTTGEQLEPAYAECGAAEVVQATAAAAAAFEVYRRTTPETRARFLEAVADAIDAIGPDLLATVPAETGLPEARVKGETGRTSGQLRMFAADLREGGWLDVRIDPGDPARSPAPRPDVRQRSVPVGPVAVFGASNFPLAFSVAGGDTASALAAGCPVVVKAHPSHPATSELVGRAIVETLAAHDLPAGTFALLHGAGNELGEALVTDPRIAAVGFTGSRGGGLALSRLAAGREVPIPVYAEMSAVNPVFLLPGALGERAEQVATGFAGSLTGSGGQLCTKPGLVFALDGDATDTFLEAAARAVAAVPTTALLNPGIGEAFVSGVRRLGDAEGVERVAEGDTAEQGPAVPGRPALFTTTGDRFLADADLAAEVFGPAGLVVQVRDEDQLHQIVAGLEGQLTASLHVGAADTDLALDLLGRLELVAGRVLFDGWPTGVEVNHAMVHGGPFPATTAPGTTSVGARAIERFLRPVAYQDVPAALLPPELHDDNPWRVFRRIDGRADTPTQETS
ncbi:2,5-dioxovalerate dehydrogenase [Marmoricola endophyticus]|uniref:2,5-dioxovalerate dehydrogenase n=1 Tax=Marmoricola endophyticus TaxID=2040280 RepID=A0A917BQD2_9ACTN|nr:aldehyde dehydrogenase (NADP(+)) [Marmoricola endophyticus]GGF54828.1 2,5-dioxovalerate dehydrogenase [Marmoricola endophyticus]